MQLTPPSRLPMQMSSGSVVAPSRRPPLFFWARLRQLGGSVAPAASTLSSRSRDGSNKCPKASSPVVEGAVVTSRASLGVGPSAISLRDGDNDGDGDGGGGGGSGSGEGGGGDGGGGDGGSGDSGGG
eukprot:scaffold9160_cov73-Phaeocystis_antarctica.AAC.10